MTVLTPSIVDKNVLTLIEYYCCLGNYERYFFLDMLEILKPISIFSIIGWATYEKRKYYLILYPSDQKVHFIFLNDEIK